MVQAGNDIIFAPRERRPVSNRQVLAYLSLCILLALLPGLARGEHPEILLIADPGMDSPIFQRSVILVTPHENGGAMGVILNRPIPVDPDRLYPGDELLAEAEQVFFGGPVRPGLLIYLFRADTAPERAVHLFADVYFSIDRQLAGPGRNHPCSFTPAIRVGHRASYRRKYCAAAGALSKPIPNWPPISSGPTR